MEPITHPIPGRLWIVQLAERLSCRLKGAIDRWPGPAKKRLGDQLSRSVDSIGANISEGYVRIHVKERLHFFSIAKGSLEETVFHLRIARERGLIERLEAYTVSELLFKLSKAIDNLVEAQKEGG